MLSSANRSLSGTILFPHSFSRPLGEVACSLPPFFLLLPLQYKDLLPCFWNSHSSALQSAWVISIQKKQQYFEQTRTDLALLTPTAVANHTAETKEYQKAFFCPFSEQRVTTVDPFPAAAAAGVFFCAEKTCPLFPAYSNLYQGKPLSTASLFILPALSLGAVAAAKGKLSTRRC